MKQILGLVAVIGLTLTAVMGCATSEESASTVASEVEASEAGSVAADCATVQVEFQKMDDAGSPPHPYETGLKTFSRIWPQMNDPDLKSIFRELANNGYEGKFTDDLNWVSAQTICQPYW